MFYVTNIRVDVKHKKIKEMALRVDYSHRKRYEILLICENDYSFDEIRSEIGRNVTKDSISKFLKQCKKIMSLQNQISKSRLRCFFASYSRRIKKLYIGDRRKYSGCIYGEIAQVNMMFSVRTVWKRLQRYVLNSRIPAKKAIFISPTNVEKIKLDTRVNWTAEQRASGFFLWEDQNLVW